MMLACGVVGGLIKQVIYLADAPNGSGAPGLFELEQLSWVLEQDTWVSYSFLQSKTRSLL